MVYFYLFFVNLLSSFGSKFLYAQEQLFLPLNIKFSAYIDRRLGASNFPECNVRGLRRRRNMIFYANIEARIMHGETYLGRIYMHLSAYLADAGGSQESG